MAVALNIETRPALFIRAGITPGFAVGGRTFVNQPATNADKLAGWDFTVEIRGIQLLDPAVDFTYDDEETIQLTDAAYMTGAGEIWVFTFQPRPVQPSQSGPTAIKYTNGFDITKVMPVMMNRVRWQQPTRGDFPFVLDGNNVWGDDDLYSPVFESGHKMITPYTVFAVQDDTAITQDKFNALLQKMEVQVILKSIKNVFGKRERLEKKLLFERFGRQDYINQNEGKFVGVRILPAQEFDKSTQVDSVSLKFDGDVTFNFYLFHDAQPTVPIKIISVSALKNQQTTVPIGEIISYAGAGNKSGVYFFGYFQNDLGNVHAINEIVSGFNVMYNFGCVPIELPALAGPAIDVNQISFTMKTHGFNIQMSSFRDFTQLIVDSPHLFDNLIVMQMAADVIELIQNSTRTNKDQRITADMTKMLYTDLNQAVSTEQVPFSVGLKTKIINELKRVRYEFFPKQKIKSITHDTDNVNLYGVPAEVGQNYDY